MMQIDYYRERFLTEEVRLPDGSAEKLLAGRKAVVTGGGKGIGKGISLRLAAAGADVLICGSGNMDMARTAAEEARALGVRADTIQADLSEEDAAERILAKAESFLGGLDVLVSNAAYQPNLDLQDYSSDRFRQVMEINLWSPVRLVSAAVPLLRKSACGRVIIVSSVHGKRTSGFDTAYVCSKGGLQMLVKEAALELKKDDITVNAILPGGTAVEFKSGEIFNNWGIRVERERTYDKHISLGTPGDMGNLAVFLASDLAGYLTGTSIRVDGGLMMF